MNLFKVQASLLLLIAMFAVAPTGVTSVIQAPTGGEEFTEDDARKYLVKYGYLEEGSNDTNSFTAALERFQSVANIDVTGVLDSATIEMMTIPRCGCPDTGVDTTTRFLFNGFQKWHHSPVTYRIDTNKYTAQLRRRVVDTIIQEGFQAWEDVADIIFKNETDPNKDPDIDILFASLDHGDGAPFDGYLGELGHALFPPFGDLHFDDDEFFTARDFSGAVNLYRLAVHEIGHTIGLGHSSDPGAAMYPLFFFFAPNFQLHQDDIDGAKFIYGAKADICAKPMSAMVTFPDCKTYAFQGKECFRIISNGPDKHRIKKGYPRPICKEFPGLPNDIQAAFVYKRSTYFLKKDEFWEMRNGEVVTKGGPTSKRFPGILKKNINAVFEDDNGDLFFLKGFRFFQFRGVGKSVIQGLISTWGLNLRYPNAAMKDVNGNIFVYQNESYYGLDPSTKQVLPGFPKPTGPDWFGCD